MSQKVCAHVRWVPLGALVGALTLLLLPLANAQEKDSAGPRYSAPPGNAGVGRYYPGKWGVVEIQLSNPGNEPANVTAVLSFRGQGEVQFGRKVWIPPHARRITWHPVLPPAKVPQQSGSWDIQSFLFDDSGDRETPLPARTGEMQLESYLLQGRVTPLTGLIADPEHADEMMHLLWAARIARNVPKTIAMLELTRLPPTVESLEGLDQLLVASNALMSYPATCAAIREWLHRGGRLWLPLNAVDPELVERLVGDALQVSVVDRVERDRLQIDSHELRVKQPVGPELKIEQPVEMIRAVFSNARTSHSVDDWSAAAWIDVGQGALLVTTLGVPAWLRDRTPEDLLPNTPEDRNDHVRYLANGALREVAAEFFAKRSRPLLAAKDWQPFVSEQIGYSIVNRQRIAMVLGLFCAGLAAVGFFLARIGSLEQIGWIGPVGVLLASLLLLGVGNASRGTIPRTVVAVQTAEASPYSNEIQVSGLAAAYTSEKSADPLAAGSGGIFWPKREGLGGTLLRMVAADTNRWELHNAILPPGTHFFPFSCSFDCATPVRGTATFGPDGVTGTITAGPFERLTDAVLFLPASRNLAIELKEDARTGEARFVAGADSVLAPGQFLAAGLLTDEQRRRNKVLALLATPGKEGDPYPATPTILAWGKRLDLGFRWLGEAEQNGATLVSIPLQFEPTLPGKRVRIPGPFLHYRSAGASMSATYDERKRRWAGPFPSGLDTTLRFQLPREVLPIRLESAHLSIGIKAPSRELQIVGFVDEKPVVLHTRRSPLGRIEFRIDREEVLRVNDAGELTLGVNVGDAKDNESNRLLDPSEAQMWRIDDLLLEVSGTTIETAAEVVEGSAPKAVER